jgi:hypothetical protein
MEGLSPNLSKRYQPKFSDKYNWFEDCTQTCRPCKQNKSA